MIRKIEIRDIEAVNEIYNQAVIAKYQTADTEIISLNDRKKWFLDHDMDTYPVFVYEEQQQVVGWVSISPYREGRKALRYTAEVSYYIHKAWQRKGLGSQLLKYAVDKAPEYGFKTLVAILLGANSGSIHLLEKFNFEKWGVLPDAADFDGDECDHLYYGLRLVGL